MKEGGALPDFWNLIKMSDQRMCYSGTRIDKIALIQHNPKKTTQLIFNLLFFAVVFSCFSLTFALELVFFLYNANQLKLLPADLIQPTIM